MRIFCSLPEDKSLARHMQDTVCIDVEGNFDLRCTSGGRRNVS